MEISCFSSKIWRASSRSYISVPWKALLYPISNAVQLSQAIKLHDENLELLTPTQNVSQLNRERKEVTMKNINQQMDFTLSFTKITFYPNDAPYISWWCNVLFCCREMLELAPAATHSSRESERATGKLKCYSPLSQVASGSCAWSCPLNMSSIVTFFLEARLSSSSVSRTFQQYFNRQLEQEWFEDTLWCCL